jgi:UDP-N-acetylglucosamine 2-epimerase
VQSIERDGFPIAARVYMVVEGENLVTSAKSTGLGLVELATVFDNLKPDAVVTIADRYETLANAVAAAYMNIPLVHIQGERSPVRSTRRSGTRLPSCRTCTWCRRRARPSASRSWVRHPSLS